MTAAWRNVATRQVAEKHLRPPQAERAARASRPTKRASGRGKSSVK